MLKGDSDDSDEAFCHILTKTKNYGNSQKVAESAWSVSRSPVHSGKLGMDIDWNGLELSGYQSTEYSYQSFSLQ